MIVQVGEAYWADKLGCDPGDRKTWPEDTIARLMSIEQRDGLAAAEKALANILGKGKSSVVVNREIDEAAARREHMKIRVECLAMAIDACRPDSNPERITDMAGKFFDHVMEEKSDGK